MITFLPMKIYLLFLYYDLTSTPQDKSAMPQVTHEQQLITLLLFSQPMSSFLLIRLTGEVMPYFFLLGIIVYVVALNLGLNFVFVSPFPPEFYLPSETKIEPDLIR